MIANKTFEKYAAEPATTSRVDYRDYPSALPMVEAFVSGNLDFGMWGNTPIVRLIAQNQPIQLRHRRRRPLPLRARDAQGFADPQHRRTSRARRSARCSAAIRTTCSSQMLRYELGNADPQGVRHHVVNTPTQAQAATIPTGMDAAVADPSGVPQGQRRDRHRRHHELVRLHRGALQGPGRRRRGHPARVGEEVAVLSRTATTCTARSGSAAPAIVKDNPAVVTRS